MDQSLTLITAQIHFIVSHVGPQRLEDKVDLDYSIEASPLPAKRPSMLFYMLTRAM